MIIKTILRHTSGSLLIILVVCMISWCDVMAQEQNSRITTLDEFVITADRSLFKVTGPNRFVYDVSKDSTLINANTIDALKKVPILNANNTGEVNAMNGKPLVFKINGLRDPMLHNLSQALTSIPAEVIKKIEFYGDNSGDGKEVIVVNIVTKGRLEGYRVQITSNVTDHSWRNGIWGLTKVRRFSTQGSYFNTWEWGHDSKSGSDEYRYGTPDTYRYMMERTTGGYKVDLHTFEASASYDVDDRSFLSISGTAMFKTDPRKKYSSTNNIYQQNGSLAAMYCNTGESRMRDAEYSASLKYERSLGDRFHQGSLNIGYQFYSRPFTSHFVEIHDLQVNNISSGIDFLNLTNSHLSLKKSYVTNTIACEWEQRVSNRVSLDVYGRFRTRSEGYENKTTMVRITSPDRMPVSESFRTSLMEYWGCITPKVAYFTNRWEVRGGFMTQAYIHRINTSNSTEVIAKRRMNILPFASTAFITKRKMLLELSYNMDNRIPDITSMDPYINQTIPGVISYGNPELRPQVENTLKLDISGKTGKLYSGITAKMSYLKNLILAYQFVNKGILNITYGNIANRRAVSLSGYVSGRPHSNSYVRFNASLNWTQYRSPALYISNQGWQGWVQAKLEQELPWNVTLDLSASYSTRLITLQGHGPQEFRYDIGLYRQFLKRKLTIIIDASSFIPVWYKANSNSYGPEYSRSSWNRTFHAGFSLTLRYTFGKLKAEVKEGTVSTVNNDIKKDYNE